LFATLELTPAFFLLLRGSAATLESERVLELWVLRGEMAAAFLLLPRMLVLALAADLALALLEGVLGVVAGAFLLPTRMVVLALAVDLALVLLEGVLGAVPGALLLPPRIVDLTLAVDFATALF
jgi:hypothetical protein